ncbi:DUF5590 domain-containing protein [Bacillus sp. 165]|uniref:cell wall elongation regulator TseB-like domain-containing protein n=1 Tax=Bacillus sp. 165 TaxID=1529117 RepID=UPI001ADBA1D4|nr:DUF5590 domain-containing protein [Bacillus sp. 165]MBO9128214.1 DUF5590 domain-containing protein [Bacillus sp. 165]
MKKWIFIATVVIVAAVFYSVHIYQSTISQKEQGQVKAVETAKKLGGLVEIISVDYYNGEAPYQVIKGINKQKKEIIIWVPEKKGQTVIRKVNDGISEQQAVQIVEKERSPKEIIKVKLGIENNVPLWEITYIDQEDRYTYYYMDYEDGKFLKRYSIQK